MILILVLNCVIYMELNLFEWSKSGGITKKLKEGIWESRGAQKQGKSMVCEILQPKKGPCENGPWLRNNFVAPKHPLWKSPPTAKWFRSLLSPCAKIFAAAKPPLGTRVPFRSAILSFRSCKMGCKNAHPFKIHPLLWNRPSAAKIKIVPWHPF